ncbi:hypothetical protein [Paracraurococcus lichenis]|uniref:Uncharacterized protein n=1 Tax=Paracraurococcus lichenis TaxID=3064888 RepID=A0ABT9ED99_9PROT|nr:hypothetical protein [Paracraurococcus sp. LOR1-02]MDO9714169.1 hypothetical protein [Paracraurococcus sp. LOR1-02]
MTYAALAIAFAALPLAVHSAAATEPGRRLGSVAALVMTGAAMVLLMVG